MKQFTDSQRNGKRRRLMRVRSNAGVCDHRAMVGLGDHVGRCLECGACETTPFTIRRTSCVPITPIQGGRLAGSGTRTANRLSMDEVCLPAVVVPVSETRAA